MQYKINPKIERLVKSINKNIDVDSVVTEIRKFLLKVLPKERKLYFNACSYNCVKFMDINGLFEFEFHVYLMLDIDKVFLQIRIIHIDEKYQNQGQGKTIIQFIEDIAYQYGYDGVAFECVTNEILANYLLRNDYISYGAKGMWFYKTFSGRRIEIIDKQDAFLRSVLKSTY